MYMLQFHVKAKPLSQLTSVNDVIDGCRGIVPASGSQFEDASEVEEYGVTRISSDDPDTDLSLFLESTTAKQFVCVYIHSMIYALFTRDVNVTVKV